MNKISNNDLISLFRVIPEPCLLLYPDAPDFTIAGANSSYAEITGTTEEFLKGKGLFDVFPESPLDDDCDGVPSLRSSLERVISTKKPHKLNSLRYDIPVRGTDRFEIRYWDPKNIPVPGEDGKLAFILHTVKDMTDVIISGKREMQALKEKQKTEKLLIEAQEVTRMGVWEFDVENYSLYCSVTTKELLETEQDYTPDPDSILEFCKDEESRKKVIIAIKNARDNRAPFDIELEIITEKGNKHWLRVTGKVTCNDDGNIDRIYGSVQDITERKKNVIELEQSRNRFQTILNAEPDCVKVISQDGRILDMNPSGLKMISRVTDEEVVGQFFKKYIHPGDRKRFQAHHKQVVQGKESKITFRVTGKNRKEFWMESSAVPLKNSKEKGFTNSNLSVSRDITERLKMEQELLVSKNKYQSLIHSINGIVWEADASTFEFTYVSPSVKKNLGYTPEQWLSDPGFWEKHIHPDDREKAVNTCMAETSKDKDHSFDYRMICDDGSVVWLRDIVSVIKKNGHPSFIRGVMLEITDQKKMWQLEQLEKDILEITALKKWSLVDILNNYIKGVESIHPEGYYSLMRLKGNRLYHWSSPSLPEEFILKTEGVKTGKITGPFGSDTALKQDIISSDIESDDTWNDLKEVSLFYGFKSCWVYPLYDYSGGIFATLVIYNKDKKLPVPFDKNLIRRVCNLLHLIIENNKNDEELRKANNELELRANDLSRSNRELETFAYAVAHDLQEPLRMVSNFMKRLEEKYADRLDEKGKEYIHFAVDGAERMRQMIKSLLNYSRVGSDEMELQEISTEKIVQDILKLNRSTIENQGAEISYKNLPKVRASYFSIFQLFYNLINNAIKYHKKDEKPVVTIIGLETESHWEFCVIDNGIGIDPRFHISVFDVFYRLHSRDEYDGTGIGLAVCKKVVELHGGTIRIESAKGMGTTIHYSISKITGTEYETD